MDHTGIKCAELIDLFRDIPSFVAARQSPTATVFGTRHRSQSASCARALLRGVQTYLMPLVRDEKLGWVEGRKNYNV